MKIAFDIVFAIGAGYFLLRARRFDVLTVGFFAAAIYFLPGFFGFVQHPIDFSVLVHDELIDPTYAVMTLVLGMIVLAAVVHDSLVMSVPYGIHMEGTASTPVWALLIGIAGLVMTLLTTGAALMNSDKVTVLAAMNRWCVLWEVGASVAAVMAFQRRQYAVFAAAFLLLLFDVFVGMRVYFALTMVAVMILALWRGGRRRLLFRKKPLMAAAFFMLFIFFYKQLLIPVKMGAWDLVVENLHNESFYTEVVTLSEPFVTQAILNEVIKADYHVGLSHFASIGYQFVFMAPSLGADAVSFNDLFQPKLFPGSLWMGMANNVWAEMWSSGGWTLLGVFIVFHAGVLIMLSRALWIRHPDIRAVLALLSSYWAFYIHRNDLFIELNMMKRVVVISLAAMILAWLSHRMLRRVSPPRRRRAAEPRAVQ